MSSSLDYVEIPSCATRLQPLSSGNGEEIRPAPKVLTSLPRPSQHVSTPSFSSITSPTLSSHGQSGSNMLSPSKLAFTTIPQLLLISTLQVPANAPPAPRTAKGVQRLLSTRDPLSIPSTTVNFKRFVARVGPVFWLQDRLEEILMWRKGTRYTTVWMAAYGFLCYFPRLVLLLPHVAVLSVMLVMHPALHAADSDDAAKSEVPTPPPAQTSEGSVDWFANVQAIQNLMGAYSDVHDYVQPVIPHFTNHSPYSPVILTFVLASLFLMVPVVYLLPIRTTFLILGLAPLVCTHPFVRLSLFPALLAGAHPIFTSLRMRLTRIIDDDRLEDKHWRSEMKEVELFENERWMASGSNDDHSNPDAGWSKANLKPADRKPWTRGRDGWSGITGDGSGDVSNLTFSLAPGWLFVETEDWRPDLEGTWIAPSHVDGNGWVYTNDAWLDPHPAPLEEWWSSGLTRRRRWTRRIYCDPELAKQ
ncbi:uncharacterized protein LAESUDRAFT_742069 [Laetiporus sulphureus 93-53]|uniref:TECPR1-like DysF domain-containing protein n=1 Tax=Laetiporus sulphureus 93-53 TaxID=1314785 RepID=A0A165FMZ7_9APHY|nr:uncharacterized protein LAESUDRAFT_742069 [Laetiporus sulphureus 93-53]KZT09213.1 hypothetical protein LAESUDRAFT_742069 [Laetiporus sulphureus 93-53]